MVQSYTPKYLNKKNNKKKTFEKFEEQSEISKDYLKIWRANPSFKDINRTRSLVKAISILVLTLMLIVSMYISSNNLLGSVILGFLFLFIFSGSITLNIFYYFIPLNGTFSSIFGI